MQPEQDPSRCPSSCGAPSLDFNAKETDFRRTNRTDPRYAAYRWDCGNYPYHKVPVPVNSSSSSSSSGVPIPYPGGRLAFSDGKLPSTTEYCCPRRGSRYPQGQGYFSHPEHCVRDSYDRRHLPHHNPEVIHWDSSHDGCPCCGQHRHLLGPNTHSGHLDSARLYVAPFCSNLSDDVLLVNQDLRNSVDEKRFNASAQCSHNSQEASRNSPQSVVPREDRARWLDGSFNPNTLNAKKSELLSDSNPMEPNNSQDKLTKKIPDYESFGEELRLEDQNDSMTNARRSTSVEEETKEKQSPTRKISSASPMLQSEQSQDLKVTSKTSTAAPQVTPLYGRPLWWGEEPEQEDGCHWKNNPSVISSSSSPSSFSSSSLPVVQKEERKSNSTAPTSICRSRSTDIAPSPQSLSEVSFKSLPIDNDTKTKPTDCRYSMDFTRHGRLSISGASVIAGTSLYREETTLSGGEKNLGHSPPERDIGAAAGSKRFVCSDPPTCGHSARGGGDLRLIHSAEGSSVGHRCREATAFIVDLEHCDTTNGGGRGGGGEGGGGAGGARGRHRITVEARLSEFLPRRCVRSLQERLSWMKRTHERRRLPMNRNEREIELTETGTVDIMKAQEKQGFKSKESHLVADDDVGADDAIADDVSDAGTYVIDDCSDGESFGIVDARERTLTESGINDIASVEPRAGKWCSSLAHGSAVSGNEPHNFEVSSERFRANLKEPTITEPSIIIEPSIEPSIIIEPSIEPSTKIDVHEARKAGEGEDPKTPTAKSMELNDFENVGENEEQDFAKQNCSIYVDEEKLECNSTQSSTGSAYKDAEAASRCIASRESKDSENFSKNMKTSTSSVSSIDTDVLLAEDKKSLKSHLPFETGKSQVTVDAGILIQDPTVFSYGNKCNFEKSRHNSRTNSLQVNKDKIRSSQSSPVVSDSRRGTMPTEKNYVQLPASLYKNNTLLTDCLDDSVFEIENSAHRDCSAVSESGDSPKSRGSVSMQDSSLGTAVSLDTRVLLSESNIGKARNDESRAYIWGFPEDNVFKSRSDFDEDGSSVDPLGDPVSARTVASLATEVLPKPTEEFVHATEGCKVHKQRRLPNEQNKVVKNIGEHQSTINTGSELSSRRSVTTIDEPNLGVSNGKLVKDSCSVRSKKPVAVKCPETKPMTQKSILKASSAPNYHLSTRRCFSDLSVADLDETVSENVNDVAQEGKASGSKPTAGNSIEQTRMNRTFALRCARREASDAGETPQPDVPSSHQRYNRASKKSGTSKFDEAQRSRSASRSRPSYTSPRSLLESQKSTHSNQSQRTVRKNQENENKLQKSNTESSSFSRSCGHNNETSSNVSQKSTKPFCTSIVSTKKKTKSDHGKVDAFNGPQGLAAKGSTVQSRPQNVSLSSPLPHTSSNEWTNRKKCNTKQLLTVETASKRKEKQSGQSTDKNVAKDRLDERAKNLKKTNDSNSLQSAPTTASDWTDDEKLQLTPSAKDLPSVCQLSAKVKLLSDQVLQALRKRPEYRVNETLLLSAAQKSSELDSLNSSSPEFLYIFHNLQAAERQMSDIYQVLSSPH